MKQQRITVFYRKGPASWPSVAVILPEFIKILKLEFKSVSLFDPLSNKKPPVNDDLWIFPIGSLQSEVILWLKKHFKDPYKRPRAVFVLNGEGAKLCYTLMVLQNYFRHDDEWVVSCFSEKNIIDHFWKNNNRTHVLFHPVNSKFKPNPKLKLKLRRKLKLPVNKSIYLYAGRLSQQKNIATLFDFITKVKEGYLLLCGDIDYLSTPHLRTAGYENLVDQIDSKIKSLLLSDKVDCRAYMSQSELLQVMQACDFQISLSAHYGEDYGYSIAQGLCVGLNTIVSHWGGHLNWGDKYVNYIPLSWKNQNIGQPVLQYKIQSKNNKRFHIIQRDWVREQLSKIINNNDYKNRNLKPSPVLVKFWSKAFTKPRAYMYENKNDRIFKKIIGFYLNK